MLDIDVCLRPLGDALGFLYVLRCESHLVGVYEGLVDAHYVLFAGVCDACYVECVNLRLYFVADFEGVFRESFYVGVVVVVIPLFQDVQ